MAITQVFISYKHHGNNGELLPDYYMAKELYEKISELGINTFFSDDSLKKKSSSDYKKIIDKCLDEASLLIVVSTSPEHCESSWVRYEWDSFYNDILSERKSGCLLSYLDTENIGEFPRTIRSLQVFEKKKNGLNEIIDFVHTYFHIDESLTATEETELKGSSYNYNVSYELGDERKRLEIQAKLESVQDKDILLKLFPSRNKTVRILDVGCSVGTVTFDVLASMENVEILGIDKFEQCVTEFNKNSPSEKIRAEILDLNNAGWEEQLKFYLSKYSLEKFDLIYCSLSLHHMFESETIVKKLWTFLDDNGYIYIRTCDDGLKIAYPNGTLINEVVKKTMSVPHVSDRFHGRKVFSMLQKAKFRDITVIPIWNDTANKTLEERYALFYSAFVWRKNYFKNRLEMAKTSDEINQAMEEYNDIISILDKIEDLFLDMSFYFGHCFIIAYGQKGKLF